MKITFSEKVSYTPTWKGNDKLPEGERVTAELSVMSMKDLLLVIDNFQKLGLVGNVDPEKVEGSKLQALLSTVGELLPKYVTIAGLESDSGPLTIDHVVRYGVFMQLATELLLQLTNVSSPSEEERGN